MVDVTTEKRDRPASGWTVLFLPRRAFVGQRERPAPLWPLVFAALFAALAPVVFTLTVDMHDFFYDQLRQTGQLARMEELPEDAKKQAFDVIDNNVIPGMKVLLPGAAAGARLVWILALAGIAFGVLRGTHKELRFLAVLGAVALAAAPLALHDLLSVLVYTLRDVHQYDPQNPVLSNAAAWLKTHPERDPLGALLSALDLFNLWTVFLCGLALRTVRDKPGAIAWILPVGGFVLIVIGRVANAFAGSVASSF